MVARRSQDSAAGHAWTGDAQPACSPRKTALRQTIRTTELSQLQTPPSVFLPWPAMCPVLSRQGDFRSCTLEHSGEGDLRLTSPPSDLRDILPWRFAPALWTEPWTSLRSSLSCQLGKLGHPGGSSKAEGKVQAGNLILIPF